MGCLRTLGCLFLLILLAIGGWFTRDWWWLILIVVVVGAVFLHRWVGTPKGRAVRSGRVWSRRFA